MLVERVQHRAGNDFGKTADELSRILGDLESIEPRLRVAHTEVRTDRPLLAVLADVLCLVGSH